MSAPFAPSPKLRQYLEWARTEAGCDIKEGYRGGKPIFKIESPQGKVVHQVGMLDSETLSHAIVAHLDRRLNINSPFPKTPDPYE